MSRANVVVLGVLIDGRHFDAPAKTNFAKGRGALADKIQVTLNGVTIHVDAEQIMDAEEYFKLYNADLMIPSQRAVGELWFVESQYAGTIDEGDSKGESKDDTDKETKGQDF